MVLKKERLLKTILDALSLLRSSCEDRGRLSLFDLHTLAESFFCPFLNEMYGLNLQLLKKRHPAIDIGDSKAGTAFQITVDGSGAKIQDTLDVFAKHRLFLTYPALKVLIIGKRQKTYGSLAIPTGVTFDSKTDILDVQELGAEIESFRTGQIERLAAIVIDEFDGIAHEPERGKASFTPLEVTVNSESVSVQNATCTFAPDAGWGIELVLHNVSSEVMESGDFSIAFALPRKVFIKDEWSVDKPKYSVPIRLDRSKLLWKMTHFDRLLPGTMEKYSIYLRTDEKSPLKVGESIHATVHVYSKFGNAEYPLRLDVVTAEQNLAAVQKRRKKKDAEPGSQQAILKMQSFIRSLEGEGKQNLPAHSWKKTFGPIDPECLNLTKKDIIRRIFATSNRGDLVTFLGAVRGMYAKQMKRMNVREKFALVCNAFGIDYDELV